MCYPIIYLDNKRNHQIPKFLCARHYVTLDPGDSSVRRQRGSGSGRFLEITLGWGSGTHWPSLPHSQVNASVHTRVRACVRAFWELVSNPSESYSHRRSVLDVIFFSQLLTGEAVVLLPESLTLPAGFLGMKQRHGQLPVSRCHARSWSTTGNRKRASLGILSARALPFGGHIFKKHFSTEKEESWEESMGKHPLLRSKDVLLPSPNV